MNVPRARGAEESQALQAFGARLQIAFAICARRFYVVSARRHSICSRPVYAAGRVS
jgi:hypothetical protein